MTLEAGREPTRWTASRVYADMWVDPEEDPRDTGTELHGERATVLEYLRRDRLTFEMRCADLDAEQMAYRSVPPSTMSLLGLVRHIAEVERAWFRRVMANEEAPPLYCTAQDRERDWEGAVGDPELVERAWQTWRAEVAFAEEFVDNAEDLSTKGRLDDGTPRELREVIVHMIEEYARHCGHADLLRERVDGRVSQ